MPQFVLRRPPVIVARQLTKDNVLETCGWLEEFDLLVRHTEDLVIFCRDFRGAHQFYEANVGSWIILTIDKNGGAMQMGVLGDTTFHLKYKLEVPSEEPELHSLIGQGNGR